MLSVEVSSCPYDPDFLCHIGCEKVKDKPWWCTHREDLYKRALEFEKEKNDKKKDLVTKTILVPIVIDLTHKKPKIYVVQ